MSPPLMITCKLSSNLHFIMFSCMVVVLGQNQIGMNCNYVGRANLVILLQLAILVAIFTWGSSYTPRILHLEGEEVFGSIKHKQNLPVGLKGDLHKHDCVNFSHMLMEFISRNSTPNADVAQSNHLQEAFLVFTHNGEEVLKHFCGDNIWCIE